MISRRDWFKSTAALSALAVPGLDGCCPRCPVEKGLYWQNHVGSISAKPAKISEPETAREILEAVQSAVRSAYRIRMTGSGHSFSDVALAGGGHMLLPSHLNRPLKLDLSRLKDTTGEGGKLVRVHSGRTIRQLNEQLDAAELGFANLGGYDGQTIVGAVSTGTHGSGLAHGPLTEQIVSWQVVTSGGEMWQIEPANGITKESPTTFPLEEDDSITVKLVQNDDFFNAMAVNIGCLGIVYAVVIRTVDKFWLHETRKLQPLEGLMAKDGFFDQLAGKPPRDHYYEVYFNPYGPKNAALVTDRERLAQKPTKLSATRGRPGAKSDADSAVLLSQGHVGKGLPDWRFASKILIDNALRNLEGDYTQVSHQVFHAGRINDARLFAVELAFPLPDTNRVLKEVLKIADEQAAVWRVHYGPISLRFVKAASAFIAPQQGVDTTMMEIGAPVNHPASRPLLEAYEQRLCKLATIRPHWGQDLGFFQDTASVQAHWSTTWSKWLYHFHKMNDRGVFDGEVTDRLKISKTAHP